MYILFHKNAQNSWPPWIHIAPQGTTTPSLRTTDIEIKKKNSIQDFSFFSMNSFLSSLLLRM